MPASGRLMLGVNDNGRGDSTGALTVIVSGGRPDAQLNWQDRQNGQDRQDTFPPIPPVPPIPPIKKP